MEIDFLPIGIRDDEIFDSFQRVGVLIEDDTIALPIIREGSDSSLSEAFSDLADDREEIQSECLYPTRDQLDRDIIRISSDDGDRSRSLDFFDIF